MKDRGLQSKLIFPHANLSVLVCARTVEVLTVGSY